MSFPKNKRYKSKKYKEFVRTLFCCVPVCLTQKNIHAHHATTVGAGGSDLSCIPLCASHHATIHSQGKDTFEETYYVDLWRIRALTLTRYVEELEG